MQASERLPAREASLKMAEAIVDGENISDRGGRPGGAINEPVAEGAGAVAPALASGPPPGSIDAVASQQARAGKAVAQDLKPQEERFSASEQASAEEPTLFDRIHRVMRKPWPVL
jgi:hypothetical protein